MSVVYKQSAKSLSNLMKSVNMLTNQMANADLYGSFLSLDVKIDRLQNCNMITIQDLYNIVGNKIAIEAQKALIRNNFPPQIAEQMCNAIDGQERAEHFQRLLKEYNEWMQNQQQETVQRFLREYYK
ncbi:MAG: hypothetical protein K6G46_05830 [Prevotella sp.]|nr:hypothetical protein [Prevotella sp.]